MTEPEFRLLVAAVLYELTRSTGPQRGLIGSLSVSRPEKGRSGERGSAGPKGDPGQQGDRGDPGSPGGTGPNGDPGQGANDYSVNSASVDRVADGSLVLRTGRIINAPGAFTGGGRATRQSSGLLAFMGCRLDGWHPLTFPGPTSWDRGGPSMRHRPAATRPCHG